MLNKIINVFISIICFGTYTLLICCAIYALIDTIGNYGWITMVQ